MATIRTASSFERPILVDIWLRSVRASHAFLTDSDFDSLRPATANYLRQPELEIWVACHALRLMGFMCLSGAVVEALFLEPDCWRKGLGTRLLTHARALRGPLSVDVNEQNESAVRFYRANGFSVSGRSELDDAGRPFPLLHLRQVGDHRV